MSVTVFHVIFVALAAAVAALYAVKPIKDWLERRRMRRWVLKLMAQGMEYGEAVEWYLVAKEPTQAY